MGLSHVYPALHYTTCADPKGYARSRLTHEQYAMVQDLVEGPGVSLPPVLQWVHFDPKVG